MEQKSKWKDPRGKIDFSIERYTAHALGDLWGVAGVPFPTHFDVYVFR